MRQISINSKDYREWAKDEFREYAACSIKQEDLSRRLRFSVSINGEFQVKFGNRLLYQGNNFDRAIKFFHDTQDKYAK